VSSLGIAAIVLGCTVTGILLGLVLRQTLPDHHTRDESKDVTKTATGMMATLVALIIGLLVSSAKSSFDAANGAVTQSGAKVITLDHILGRYGPDAAPIRPLLHKTVETAVHRIWSSESAAVSSAEGPSGFELVYDKVRDLKPQSESDNYLKSQALQLSSDLMQSRWLLIEQSQSELPTAFLVVLTFWLTVLFAGFGLLAPRNLTALSSLGICALSMAGAVYLILELSHPLEGSIKVSSGPLVKALNVIGK
jgi:hypothetical protein